MTNHQDTDRRSLLLAEAVAQRISDNPELLLAVREWTDQQRAPAYREWQEILQHPWEHIKPILLEDSDEGQRLRQSSPFVGILTPQERWKFFPMNGL